jgi:hypothetical protein
MSADCMLIGRAIAPLGDVPDGKCRDGGPELVIRGEHPWLVSSQPVRVARSAAVSGRGVIST